MKRKIIIALIMIFLMLACGKVTVPVNVQDIEMNYMVAQKILNSDDWPEWRPGNEFRKIREASISSSP